MLGNCRGKPDRFPSSCFNPANSTRSALPVSDLLNALQQGTKRSGHLKVNHPPRNAFGFAAVWEQHRPAAVWAAAQRPREPCTDKGVTTGTSIQTRMKSCSKEGRWICLVCYLQYLSASLFNPVTISIAENRNAPFLHGIFPMVNLIKQPLKRVLARLYQGDLELLLNVNNCIPH